MIWGKSGDEIRRGIIERAGAKADAAVGVVSSIGKEQRVDEKNRSLWVTATTSDIDLEREVVVPSGADTTYFFGNRSIFVDHQTDFGHCVGKLRSAKPRLGPNGEQDGWLCHIGIAPLTKSPFANDVLVLAREGGVSVSVGYIAHDFGKPTVAEMKRYAQGGLVPRSIVRAWEWIELSITMFPCNLQARQVGYGEPAGKSAPGLDALVQKRLGVVDNLLVRGAIAPATAEAFGFPLRAGRSDRPIRRIVLVE